MYYNVVIKDDIEEEMVQNELIFYFDDKEKAIKFLDYIITISNYHIELLQFSSKNKMEG